jgi:cytochrome c peroxidase
MKSAVVAALALALTACAQGARPATEVLHERYAAQLDTLTDRIDAVIAAVRTDFGDGVAPRRAYEAARAAFKGVEHLAEYYYPAATERINGPPIDEREDDDGALIPAEGFQMVEPLLYPAMTRDTADLLNHLRVLRADVVGLRGYATATTFGDENVFDAVRQELVRVFALGLSGFDSGVALRSVPEAATALRGVWATLAAYGERLPSDLRARLDGRFASALAILDRDDDFASFDRLAFLREELIPLHRQVDEARRAAGVGSPAQPSAWRADAASPYDAGALDPSFFAPDPGAPASAALVRLGSALFADPILSGDGTRACTTCHQPERAFTDRETRHAALGGGRLERNTPTVINAGLGHGSFHDLRTFFLEDQVSAVIGSPREMGSSSEAAALRLSRVPEYVRAFAEAGGGGGDVITGRDVERALAAYVRSLVALDAPFDRYVRGDDEAMNASQQRGFNVFIRKGRCGSCHYPPLFSGAVPPTWSKTEIEVLGVPSRPDTVEAAIDPDEGRFRVNGSAFHRYGFRTPTLRSVALTAPYMHNGVYATLEQVVDFYDRGGGEGIGIALPNQTLPPEPLDLTAGEKRDLVAFMKALTDTAVAQPVPLGR